MKEKYQKYEKINWQCSHCGSPDVKYTYDYYVQIAKYDTWEIQTTCKSCIRENKIDQILDAN
jgi:hypothetical protein